MLAEALFDSQAQGLMQKAADMALGGDPQALRARWQNALYADAPHAACALRSARALRTLRLRVPRAATSRSYETLEANPRFRVLPRGSGQSFIIGAAKSGIKDGKRARRTKQSAQPAKAVGWHE